MSLAEKIAYAVSLNLFEMVKDPILTEEELLAKADEAFKTYEEQIRNKDTK